MKTVYVESSAALRWLLQAGDAAAVQALLEGADQVVTSALTAAEVGRTLRRLAATGAIDPEARDRLALLYAGAAAHWTLYAVTDGVLARAAEAFPLEPIRTLDAVHLATALAYAREVRTPVMVSVGARIRDNARGLGLAIAP